MISLKKENIKFKEGEIRENKAKKKNMYETGKCLKHFRSTPTWLQLSHPKKA